MKIQKTIENKLSSSLAPAHLSVENESHKHNVPEHSETHFKVICVTDQFKDLARVRRHQHVYAVLADELSSGVHALALHLYSEDEWSAMTDAPDSPDCLGGGRS